MINFAAAPVASGQRPDAVADGVDITPQVGGTIPEELVFRDASGERVRLGNYLNEKPIVLTPVYYRCPMLCGMELKGLVACLRAMTFDVGKDFEIVTYSIDPSEDYQLAAEKKRHYLKQYGRPGAGAGWHFLTGTKEAVNRLNDCIGFQTRYDPATGEYAHAAAIMIITPQGRIARYHYGVDFAPRDLRLSIVEASQNRLSHLTDRALLLCYAYDPTRGTYGLAILRCIRIAGIVTVLAIGGVIARFLWRDRQARASARPPVLQPSEDAA